MLIIEDNYIQTLINIAIRIRQCYNDGKAKQTNRTIIIVRFICFVNSFLEVVSMVEMSEAAKQARREYYRQYREKNRERIRKRAIERWERKAAAQEVKTDEPKEDD